jgi:hypothetical protein
MCEGGAHSGRTKTTVHLRNRPRVQCLPTAHVREVAGAHPSQILLRDIWLLLVERGYQSYSGTNVTKELHVDKFKMHLPTRFSISPGHLKPLLGPTLSPAIHVSFTKCWLSCNIAIS